MSKDEYEEQLTHARNEVLKCRLDLEDIETQLNFARAHLDHDEWCPKSAHEEHDKAKKAYREARKREEDLKGMRLLARRLWE